MTAEHQASRTIVKSPPELWAECSDAGSLVRHIGEFGEIRITRLEPETTVAWEGEHASGTVEIEPSGWGTKVTLTARAKAEEVAEEPAAAEEPRPAKGEEPAAAGEEPAANGEEPAAAGEEPAANETQPSEEEADAKVEETPAEPDPAVAADRGRARVRWKRLTARARAALRPRSVAVVAAEPLVDFAEPPVDPPEPPAHVAQASALDSPEAVSLEAETAASERELTPSIDPEVVLVAALDSLGQAHHRPFSRA